MLQQNLEQVKVEIVQSAETWVCIICLTRVTHSTHI